VKHDKGDKNFSGKAIEIRANGYLPTVAMTPTGSGKRRVGQHPTQTQSERSYLLSLYLDRARNKVERFFHARN